MEVESWKVLSSFDYIWSKNDLFHIEDMEAQKSMVVLKAQLEWFLWAMTESTRGSEDHFFPKSKKLDRGRRKLLKFRRKDGWILVVTFCWQRVED